MKDKMNVQSNLQYFLTQNLTASSPIFQTEGLQISRCTITHNSFSLKDYGYNLNKQTKMYNSCY